jgi:hypothetical protein
MKPVHVQIREVEQHITTAESHLHEISKSGDKHSSGASRLALHEIRLALYKMSKMGAPKRT